MKLIPLTNSDLPCMVDDENYEFLMQWKWQIDKIHGGVVRCTSINGIKYSISIHAVLLKAPEGYVVDHKNRNRRDNQKNNLRKATRSQNQQNHGFKSNNTSGYRGVSFNVARSTWQAFINVNYKKIWLGYFLDIHDAAHAYDKAAQLHFGEFAGPPNIVRKGRRA